MSRYGYDSSLAPGPKGRLSLFRKVLMVGAIAAISAVSGGIVALDLLGSGSNVADRPALVTPQTQPVSVRVARAVTPAPAQPAARAPTNAGAAVEKPRAPAATAIAAPAQPPARPSTTPAPQVASTPDAAPAASVATVSVATVEEPKTVQVSESELTFTTGYARRRAVQTAATTGAGTKTEVARVEEQNQIGRSSSSRVKPRTTVARQNMDSRRVADAQAFAFGDPRATRRPSPQQQGGLFSSSPFGGFFRKLF
jgi:hypothetical protein